MTDRDTYHPPDPITAEPDRPPDPVPEEPRPHGAQVGNVNALKAGYRSERLTEAVAVRIDAALDVAETEFSEDVVLDARLALNRSRAQIALIGEYLERKGGPLDRKGRPYPAAVHMLRVERLLLEQRRALIDAARARYLVATDARRLAAQEEMIARARAKIDVWEAEAAAKAAAKPPAEQPADLDPDPDHTGVDPEDTTGGAA